MRTSALALRMASRLAELEKQAQMRDLSLTQGVNLCSNDYSGLAADSRLKEALIEGIEKCESSLAAGTLNYKLNNFVTFVLEESYYRIRAVPLTASGTFPLFQGLPNREWKDFRTEFGPIISF
jgi:hypothetical protein